MIDEAALDGMEPYLRQAAASPTERVLAGGRCDKTDGFFVEPTLIVTENPRAAPMERELFGPILTAYVLTTRNGPVFYS